jgi:arylsulfatase
MSKRTNVVIILNDDMGFSDLGCYGGEIDTPNLNRLAQDGIRFTQFYNTARCSPSRASLLTGLHPQQLGIGILVGDQRPEGYAGDLGKNGVTIAEVLRQDGYRTYMTGKWHISANKTEVTDSWPNQRGFDRYFGTIAGSANYFYPATLTRDNVNIDDEALNNPDFYYTDAISQEASRYIEEHSGDSQDQPFFLYVAFTSPHWPLHAPPETIEKYKGRFNDGWDKLREQRLSRMREMGLLDPGWGLSARDETVPAWEDADNKEWQLRRMEVYAAQVDRMDQGIGRILDTLKKTNQWDDTLIIYLTDNGGCAEEKAMDGGHRTVKAMSGRYHTRSGAKVHFGNDPSVMPGTEDTYQSYGVPWANLSNTPFRLYKHWVHEGGISTPFIVHWPGRVTNPGSLRHTPGQLTDIMATVLEAAGAHYPVEYEGHPIDPLEGISLMPVFAADQARDKPLYWEHEGNCAVRVGPWKLVRNYPGPWELFDIEQDRSELNDLSGDFPERVQQMAGLYQEWADRCGVIPRDIVIGRNQIKGNSY